MDFEAWRCCHDTNLFCPNEGCPASYGCARDKGWSPGMPSPRECQGLPSLENMRSHTNYNPSDVALARLLAVTHGTQQVSEGQLASITGFERVKVREYIDAGRDSIEKRRLPGKNGAAIMKQMGL